MKEMGQECMQDDQYDKNDVAWTQRCGRVWNESSRRWARKIDIVPGNYCVICLIVLQGDAQFAENPE